MAWRAIFHPNDNEPQKWLLFIQLFTMNWHWHALDPQTYGPIKYGLALDQVRVKCQFPLNVLIMHGSRCNLFRAFSQVFIPVLVFLNHAFWRAKLNTKMFITKKLSRLLQQFLNFDIYYQSLLDFTFPQNNLEKNIKKFLKLLKTCFYQFLSPKKKSADSNQFR